MREDSVVLDLRGIDLSNERFTARKFNEYAYMKNSDKHLSSVGKMSGIHFEHSILDNAHFEGVDASESHFDFASMTNVEILQSNFSNSSFAGATGSQILMEKSDFSGSSFVFADLRRSEINDSNLEGCDFTGSLLAGFKISNNSCDATTRFVSQRVKVLREDNSFAVLVKNKIGLIGRDNSVSDYYGENTESAEWRSSSVFKVIRDEYENNIDEDCWSQIKEIYRQLKLMFRSFGFYSEADMYFFLELKAKRRSHSSLFYRSVMKVVELLTGYGIKIERMVLLALVNVVFFTVIYLAGSSFLISDENVKLLSFTEKTARALYFSIVTFTTVGYGDIHPAGFMRFVANAEAFSGLLIMGLFVVSITRKFIGD
ncbi:MAG: ion channel [bacterium]|nr:ion channel [bacterium]